MSSDNTIGYADDHGTVSYDQIRRAMRGQPYPFSAFDEDGQAVVFAVNQGIDAHLEACNLVGKDTYIPCENRLPPSSCFPDGAVLAVGIRARVSPDSLPVLLRRLLELPALIGNHHGMSGLTQQIAEAGESFALAIIDNLLTDQEADAGC